jgi:hypothetical protein
MMDRIMGVVMLKAPTYRTIADDQSGTQQAAIIVVIATLVSGFFGGLVNSQTGNVTIGLAIIGAIVGVILGLIGWYVSAWVLAFVAGKLGGKTDTSEMLRVTGYVEVFSLVAVLNVVGLVSTSLLCIVGLMQFAVAILKLIGYVIGVREAAEFSTGNAVITAIVAIIVNIIIAVVIGGTILTTVAVAMAVVS